MPETKRNIGREMLDGIRGMKIDARRAAASRLS